MNTSKPVPPVSLPTLDDLLQRVKNLEQLTALLTRTRQERRDDYNPIPPCK